MKETCNQTGLSYYTLKFYCNEGLVPNVKRDKNNYRIFDDNDVAWIGSLSCIKNCNMSIQEMKEYLNLCLEGEKSISQRQVILDTKLKELERKMQKLQKSIDYIHWKQGFYNDVLSGKTKYYSNLISVKNDDYFSSHHFFTFPYHHQLHRLIQLHNSLHHLLRMLLH